MASQWQRRNQQSILPSVPQATASLNNVANKNLLVYGKFLVLLLGFFFFN